METTDCTTIDTDALELAIAHTLAEPDLGRVEQVKTMLEERDRMEVGRFCAYQRQHKMLHLQPWESPPCWINDPDEVLAADRADDHKRERAAAILLKKMLALGISQYHPDPLAAIEAATK
jgi:hypothetical protein